MKSIFLTPGKMRTLMVFLTICMFGSNAAFGQDELSGAYTIDPAGGGFASGNFGTFTAAADSLKSRGVSGPVTFTVADGIYEERFLLEEISGTSETNTILFVSATEDSTAVVLRYPTNSENNGVVRIKNAEHITFRYMTIQATGTSYAIVVRLQDEANYNTFENCELIGSNTTSNTTNHIVVYTYDDVAEYNTIQHCVIRNGSYGIRSVGISNNYLNDNVYTHNQFYNQSEYGIYCMYHNTTQITNNTFEFTNTDATGIYMNTAHLDIQITNNRMIFDYLDLSGIYLYSCNGNESQRGLIANNEIIAKAGSGKAIYLNSSTYQNVYYNSALITNASNGNTGVLEIANGSNNSINVQNNNIVNFGPNYAYYVSDPTAVGISDFNNFYSTGNYLGYWGSTGLDELSDLQTASGKDSQSVSANPVFTSETDLHPGSPLLDGTANPVTEVLTDKDDIIRDGTDPDIGAFEFSATGNALSGTYTIGSTGDYTTFTEAVEAMDINGIDGPMIFNVQDGVYEENIKLLQINGASASNTITFQSVSADSTAVTLSYEGTTDDNYIVWLAGAGYITFRDIGFAAQSTTYARVFRFTGNNHDISIENCSIFSSTSYSDHSYGIQGEDVRVYDISILNTRFYGGRYGIRLENLSNAKGTGILIEGCTFSDHIGSDPKSIWLEYQEAPVVRNNTLYNTSDNNYTGIFLEYCDKALEVTGNDIYSNTTNYGILLEDCVGTITSKGLIANNFINIDEDDSSVTGIREYDCDHMNFYYNTVRVAGTSNNTTAFMNTGGSTFIELKNNNLSNVGSGYALYSDDVNSFTEATDHNNLFTTGDFIAYLGNQKITNLELYQGAVSPRESNSVSVFPAFVASDDLHTYNHFLDGMGTPIGGLTTDIDGEDRDASNPDIGADEFASLTTPLAAGTYTIGGSSPDYATIKAAFDDLHVKGISGSVTFNIRSGQYNELIGKVYEIPGTSADDTITFQSESQNPEDVVIFYGTDQNNRTILKLIGIDHFRMKHLTITSSGSSYGRPVSMTGECTDVLFKNNRFTSANTDLSLLYINAVTDDIVIKNNYFSGGDRGINFSGNSDHYSTATLVTGNTITGSDNYGIYLDYQLSPVISYNHVKNTQHYYWEGIRLSRCDQEIVVWGNVIESDYSDYGLYLYDCESTDPFYGLIANNTMYMGGASTAYGIYLYSSKRIKLYYNSVNITSTNSNSGIGIYIRSNNEEIELQNNNIANTGNGYALYTEDAEDLTVSDYNNLFTGGENLARWDNTNYTSLAALQTASGMDAHSVSVNPKYYEYNDLQSAQPALHEAATPLSEVVLDLAGTTRDEEKPDIGAFEFTCETPSFEVSVSPSCLGDSTIFIDNSTGIARGSTFKWDFNNDFSEDLNLKQMNDTVKYLFATAGVHTVNFIIDQIAGCQDFTSIDVTVNALPDLEITAEGAYCGNDDGSASVEVLTGTAPYSYNWSTDSTGTSVSGLAIGTYTVAVTDDNGCTNTETVDIGERMGVVVEEISPSSCGVNDGIAQVTVTGGVAPYNYVWSNGLTGQTNDQLAPGLHYVNIEDANGCTSRASINMSNDGSGPQIALEEIQHNLCFGLDSGKIDITITGGTLPYDIEWSNGETVEDIDSLRAGGYDITVTDADGCVGAASYTITQPPRLIVNTITEDAACAQADGQAVAVVSGGSEPYAYTWSSGGIYAVEENLAAGIYNVTITDMNGCQEVAPVIIKDVGGPEIIVESVTGVACNSPNSGAIDIRVSGGTPLYDYNWLPGAETSQDLTGINAGTYTITVTDDAGCVGVKQIEVTEVAPAKQEICLVTVDSLTGNNVILWSKDDITTIDYYNIYREGTSRGSFQLIGQRPADSLSLYVDSLADPTVRSWRYRISAVDECGNESVLSETHKTIHLTMNVGISGEVNLIWDDYEGFEVSTYKINRYATSTGWEVLTEVPSNLNSYTDVSPPADDDLFYFIEVPHPGGGCTATKAKKNYNTVRSNRKKKNNALTGIFLGDAPFYLNLYPNPALHEVTLEVEHPGLSRVLVEIIDAQGQLAMQKYIQPNGTYFKEVLDISTLSKGMYFFRLRFGDKMYFGKLIKM